MICILIVFVTEVAISCWAALHSRWVSWCIGRMTGLLSRFSRHFYLLYSCIRISLPLPRWQTRPWIESAWRRERHPDKVRNGQEDQAYDIRPYIQYIVYIYPVSIIPHPVVNVFKLNASLATRAVYRTIELTDGWTGRIIHTQVYFSTFALFYIIIMSTDWWYS